MNRINRIARCARAWGVVALLGGVVSAAIAQEPTMKRFGQGDPREPALIYHAKGHAALVLDDRQRVSAVGLQRDATTATTQALQQCTNRGGQGCRVAATFDKWCVVAYAGAPSGDTRPKLFYEDGWDDGEAAERLSKQCQQATGGACRQVYAGCPNV